MARRIIVCDGLASARLWSRIGAGEKEVLRWIPRDDESRSRPTGFQALAGGLSPASIKRLDPKAGDEFALVSEFFEIRVRAKFNDQYRFLVSVLHRDPSNGKISLISRDMGQRFIFKYSRDYSEEARQSEYDIDI